MPPRMKLDDVKHLLDPDQLAEAQKPAKRKKRVLSIPKLDIFADRDIRPSGTIIFEGVIYGRAVPWKAFPRASVKGKHAAKRADYARFTAWKKEVGQQARILFGSRLPYAGPVNLQMVFHLSGVCGRPPDAMNLGKCFEDALQGICYVNDTQVGMPSPDRRCEPDAVERVEFKVIAR